MEVILFVKFSEQHVDVTELLLLLVSSNEVVAGEKLRNFLIEPTLAFVGVELDCNVIMPAFISGVNSREAIV